MTETKLLIEAIRLQSQQTEHLTKAIGEMVGIMAEMLDELASQNQAEQGPNNEGYLDD